MSYIGQSVPRANAKRLLQGRGAYVDDLRLPRLAHVAYFRSPHAHARMKRLEFDAAKAMPAGGIAMIRFSLKQSRVITEIEDTGSGISSEIFPKLFEPFMSTDKLEGTGLGLSICRKVIEDHGGRIWPESKPGRGAIFVFSIPRPA